jgi:hypothetical protein
MLWLKTVDLFLDWMEDFGKSQDERETAVVNWNMCVRYSPNKHEFDIYWRSVFLYLCSAIRSENMIV